jgi:putative sigma-54 modulation protein
LRTIVKGKNLDVSDADRRYAEQKLQRLGRLLDDRSEVIVELAKEHSPNIDQRHIVEVTLVMDGQPLRGAARGATFREATDTVVDKVERLAVDHKKRPRKARTRPIAEQTIRHAPAAGEEAEAEEPTGGKPSVVKVKRFAIEPMFEEDAVARMEERGHAFFLFVNAENERLALLYRRRDGDFGLIEPVIGGAYTPGRSARK